jgi:hypothetical protein
VNVDELLRSSLHSGAESTMPIDDLLGTTIARGRRRQRVRRAAAVGGSVMTVAALTGGAVAVASLGPDQTQSVTPGATAPSDTTTPWWQTWTTGRHNGPVNDTFLKAARPIYDPANPPEDITVWATGSMPDGTDWVMYTSPHSGNEIQWLQGWNGSPDYGESPNVETPDITWTSFESPTLAAHDDYTLEQQWLIVVGRPGTTTISYAANGTDFTPMDVHDGIGVLKINGYVPTQAKVQLSDASGVYATGTPYGAGPDPQASPSGSPTATAASSPGATVPSPSPTTDSGFARAQSVSPTPGSPLQVAPTPGG